ncbi:MAG TPA: alpha/beta hydrolase [Verrucomicrobiae bacterium]|nr:alpha/beta hydrolase [Verrucomicrobiae bacterium]
MRIYGPLLLAPWLCAAAPQEIPLWPGTAPGEKTEIGPEQDTTKPKDNLIAGRPVIRLGNVSKPTITIYRAKSAPSPGPAVVVFPGGGYHILAMDLEGTEVCEWLNSIGITAVLLKYRVPRREGLERYAPPLQDAQRALGMVRHRAKDLGLDESKIGVLGFSAGAHLGATLAAQSAKRTYETIDAADQLNCRPDFLLLIYPGGLVPRDQPDQLGPEVQVTSNSPPAFIVMTQDDPVRPENALLYALALKKVGVPCELHLYPKGGHGYGLRKSKDPVTGWPSLAAAWLESINSAPLRGTPRADSLPAR